MPLGVVLASKSMDTMKTMKKIVAQPQDHIAWIVNALLEMDGTEVMLKSMESNIVMTLIMDIANPLRLHGNRLIPKNGVDRVNLLEEIQFMFNLFHCLSKCTEFVIVHLSLAKNKYL